MKNLIRIFLIVVIVGAGISIGSSCSDENDCSLAGRPMMYCTLYTIDEITDLRVNDTLDSLTITALGTDSIILNNQKKVHTLMLPLRYTSDTTVFIFRYDPDRKPNDVDTLIIVQQNTPYFQSMECGYMMKTKHSQCEIRQSEKNRRSGKNRLTSYIKQRSQYK